MADHENRLARLKRGLAIRLNHRLGWLLPLALIGVSAMSARALYTVGLGHSALLYLLLPYSMALLIEVLRPDRDRSGAHWGRDLTLTSLTVFLGSSVVLGEGFICVLFFMPFYFIGLALVVLTRWLKRLGNGSGSRSQLSMVPLLVLALSLEGTTPALTFERANTVTHTAIVDHAPAQLLRHLEQPIDLNRPRHWMLSIFPMPEVLTGQKMAPGERHRVRVHYPRWFIANVHSGTMEMEIQQADATGVLSRVRADSTLFSNYLAVQRIDLHFDPLAAEQTAVSIAIAYDRKLDPAWYFQPVIRFAVTRMAEHLLEEIVRRD